MIDKIDELFDILGIESVLSELDSIKVGNDLHSRFIESYLATTVRDKIVKEVKNLFATVLSEEEIDGMLEFYRSNIGQAYLKKVPILHREAIYIGKKITKEMMSDEKLDEEFEMWKSITSQEKKILH